MWSIISIYFHIVKHLVKYVNYLSLFIIFLNHIYDAVYVLFLLRHVMLSLVVRTLSLAA